jgi:peptidyl-prolyl cis-trans isomerase D
MLEGLRKNRKIIIWVIVISFLATIFIAWGMHFMGGKNEKNYVAKINGKKISIGEFSSLYNEWLNRYKEMYGDALDDEMAENLRRMLLSNMIASELLYKEAVKEGIKVTKEEIEEIIKSAPIFKNSSGQFDAGRYAQGKKVLPKSWWKAQEKESRMTLMAKKLEAQIKMSIKITGEEIREYSREKNMSLKISYLPIPRASFSSISVSQEELNKFYDEHKEEFRKPDQVKVEYLAARKPSENDVPDSGTRGIIIKNISMIMENALKDLDKGQDLKSVGKKYSLETGETPLFDKKQMATDPDFQVFTRAAFTLSDPGEIADITQSTNYYYIIKMIKRIDAYVPGLDEVKNTIEKNLKAEKQDTLAKAKAEEILKKLNAGGEKEFASGIKTTPFFSAEGEIPGFSGEKEIKGAVFELGKGKWSAPLKTNSGYCLIRLDERRIPNVTDTTQIDTQLKEELLQIRQYQALQEWFAALRKTAKIENVLYPEKKEEAEKNKY